MIDHIGLIVSDVERSKTFYSQALKPLGIGLVKTVSPAESLAHTRYLFGEGKKPFLALSEGEHQSGPMHLAFEAMSHEAVDDFFAAAMAGGARDNGQPGPRPSYGPDYYGAFVIDPDGHNLEAACRKPH